MSLWSEHVQGAQAAVEALDHHISELVALRDETTAGIVKLLRGSGAADLDPEAIAASVSRPYTLIPSGKHGEWYAVHYRGIKMPLIGWLEKQEPAFNLFRITRSMDLLTPFPQWMRDELELKPPAHGAVIDSTRTSLRVTSGDESTFKKRYGAFLGKQNADGTYKIKTGEAWLKLVAQLIKDGILPYQAQPMDDRDWDDNAVCKVTLRDYQLELVKQFCRTGAMLLNIPPGAGKTYITTYLLAHVRGKHLVCVDTTTAREQWTQFLAENAPNANVTVTTYQGAGKYVNDEFVLFVPDEAHRLPAATFSKLAFIKAKYRIGPTGTAWREDDRQFMITALTGYPGHLSWSELIRNGVLRAPRIVVTVLKDEAAKTNRVKELVGKHRGRALIFCDWIDAGNALANALGVPFVHGETRNKLEQIRSSPVCVVSRIADTSLDLPDLSLVIDYGFMRNARTQGAQRLGRLLHSEKGGEYHLLLTAQEAASEPRRLWGIEQELLGEVDIEHVDLTGVSPTERKATPARVKPKVSPHVPLTEMERLLAVPSVANLIAQADAKAGVKSRGYVRKAIVIAWDNPVTLEEIRIGMAVERQAIDRYRNGFKQAMAVGLVADLGDGRYLTDKGRIRKLADLAGRFKK